MYQQFIGQLLVLFVPTFVLAAAGTVFFSYATERAKQRAVQQEVIDVYANSLVRPLWDCDTATLQGITNALAQHPNIARVQLDDPCSNSQITIEVPSLVSTIMPLEERNLVYHDEQGRDHVVGRLAAQFFQPSITAAAMDMFWRYLVIFIAIVGVMLIGALLVFRRIVGHPLRQFQMSISADLDADHDQYALPGLLERNDELGDVVRAYKRMMQELDVRYERQKILAQCARDLLATANHASLLRGVLDRIRATVHSDRLYIAEKEMGYNDRLRLRRVALSGRPLPVSVTRQRPDSEACDERWKARLKQRLPVFSDETDAAILHRHGVAGISAFPVWGQSQWYGVLCAEDATPDRNWSDSDLTFMQTVADMIGAYIEQAHHRRRLAEVIEQLRANEKQLLQMARHDPLTGLGNRHVLDETLALSVHRARRTGVPGYVLLIDLNHFKPINDTFGHALGDQVLQVVANRLGEVTRFTDRVIRLGGDEFVIIVDGIKTTAELEALIKKLRSAIAEPQVHAGQTLSVGASIGAACFPRDGISSAELVAHADRAMYQAKAENARNDSAVLR